MTALDLLSLNRHIDGLIARWLPPGLPGGVIGVIRDGEWLVRRGYGLASLELGVPNQPETVYRVASVTKQFTTSCILLLAAEGRLSIDADIRDWFPRLADFGHRITVRHLMQNTSGLRDQLEITRLGGMTLATPCTADDVLEGIFRQRTLNFLPGDRFLYSNTNFRLLGMIVEAVEGRPLADVMAARLFEPLGMRQTRLARETGEVIPGMASGYLERPGPTPGFVRAVHAYPLGGEGGVASSLDDLALWARNLDRPAVGGAELVQALTTSARFNGGRPNFYANGVELGRHAGRDTVGHGGLWPGFRTEFLRLPTARLTIICIANVGSIDPYATARGIADHLLDAPRAVAPAANLPEGLYLDRETPGTVELAAVGGRLEARMNGVRFTLARDPDGRFSALRGAFDLTFGFSPDHQRLTIELSSGQRFEHERLTERGRLPAALNGRYRSDELAADWTIAGASLHIEGPIRRVSAPWALLPLDGDLFQITSTDAFQPGALDARVIRGADGAPAGLLVQGGRIKNLRLTRVGPAAPVSGSA